MASTNASGQRGPHRGRGGGRHNARGGIQKQGQGPRTDRDGDMNMDGPSRGRGGPRARRSASSEPNRNGSREGIIRKSPRPGRNPFATVKRAINQQQQEASGKSSGAARFAAAMEAASKGTSAPGRGARSDLVQLTVRGWTNSKAASNPGGCQQQLVEFLERKASNTGDPAERKNVRISKSHTHGDTLTISVNPEFVPSLMRIDTFTFAGAPISIREKPAQREQRAETDKKPQLSESGRELKDRIKSMLERRYNADHRLLDLASLGTDPEFANSGMFDSASTQAKFFPALMKVAGDAAPSAAQKREMITSVTLSNNSLPDVSTVTTLAQTFPEIKNLDLSNNNFRDLKALEAWRRRFRSLDMLILTGNPLETQVPNYHEEILRWYPTLRTLNNVQVRTDEQVAAAVASKGAAIIPIARPCLRDESAIGEKFLTFFFPAYDADRASLAASFYDANAAFSYSINTSAKRLEEKTADWQQYIKNSRNMTKITSFNPRKQRLSRGTERVRETWAQLPPTKHPDLATEADKWCIECHPIGGVPDPNTTNPGAGVTGLIIYAHGEFNEIDISTMQVSARRSFDRTFVLGPGGGLGGIRVISDILTIRAYGGNEAFQPSDPSENLPSQQQIPQQIPPAAAPMPKPVVPSTITNQPITNIAAPLGAMPIPSGLIVPEGFAQAQPGKPDDQLQKEVVALQLCAATRLTLDYARMCLEQNSWNLELAGVAFNEAREAGALPPEAFF